LVVNVVVVGLFEEEQEGIGKTSEVVKVKGEDLDTPGYLRGHTTCCNSHYECTHFLFTARLPPPQNVHHYFLSHPKWHIRSR